MQYISSAAKAGKEGELLSLAQGDLSVTDYESQFSRLLHFTDNMFQTEDRKARMFERGLKPQIRRYLVSQSFSSLREVDDAAIKQEVEILAAQKGKEAVGKSADKGKGKRPFPAAQQGGAQAPGYGKKWDPQACRNYGKLGHYAKECRYPPQFGGPGGQQGGRGQGQYQRGRGQ